MGVTPAEPVCGIRRQGQPVRRSLRLVLPADLRGRRPCCCPADHPRGHCRHARCHRPRAHRYGKTPLGCLMLTEPRLAAQRDVLHGRLTDRIARGVSEGDLPDTVQPDQDGVVSGGGHARYVGTREGRGFTRRTPRHRRRGRGSHTVGPLTDQSWRLPGSVVLRDRLLRCRDVAAAELDRVNYERSNLVQRDPVPPAVA